MNLCFLHRWAPGQWQHLWQWCGDILPQTQLYRVSAWRQLTAISEQNAPQLWAGRTYRRQNLACWPFPTLCKPKPEIPLHQSRGGRQSESKGAGGLPAHRVILDFIQGLPNLASFLGSKMNFSCHIQMVSSNHSTQLWLGVWWLELFQLLLDYTCFVLLLLSLCWVPAVIKRYHCPHLVFFLAIYSTVVHSN